MPAVQLQSDQNGQNSIALLALVFNKQNTGMNVPFSGTIVVWSRDLEQHHASSETTMKILIVDDSKPMRRLVIRTIKEAGFVDHDFVEAKNGAAALETIDSESPDLVLSDWNMPEMDGLGLLNTLRQRGNQIDFGFVTSECTDEMRELAETSGALFLIGKPFAAEDFALALHGLVSK